MRQAKIGQAIKLLREAGLVDFQGGGGFVQEMNAEQRPRFKRTMSAEAKAMIGEKMKLRWAEKKAKGQNMNPKHNRSFPRA
jgi:hypothetical protein